MHSTKFLDGLRIVTMAQNVPGPLAAMRMNQAGAHVIKIEPPTGDPLLALSPAWHAEMHAGISIERLDLKTDTGRERMTVLLSDADVFMTSQRPSSLTRLGLDPDTLRSRFPRLRILRTPKRRSRRHLCAVLSSSSPPALDEGGSAFRLSHPEPYWSCAC